MIYDCFTFYNEFGLLELRLNELNGVVDKFVIVEANKTFSGKSKPFHFLENKKHFEKFQDKIIHIPCEFPDQITNKFSKKYDDVWAREYYQRDQIGAGLSEAKPDDLVIVSDVDEIICAKKIAQCIPQRTPGELTIFEMPLYRYYVNRLVKDSSWLLGPRMISFSDFSSAQCLRMTKACASKRLQQMKLGHLYTRLWNKMHCGIGGTVRIIPNAGWHFTSIGGWQDWRKKADAFSHQECKLEQKYACEETFKREITETTQSVPISDLPSHIRSKTELFTLYEPIA